MKTTKARFDFDVAVIGGGSGGYAAARTATAAGLRTVVIEGGKEVGGLCILRGCMPTKAMLHAAEVLHTARKGKVWGLKIPKTGFDFTKVMARKSAMITDFADYRRKQLTSGKFEFIRALARFRDKHTIELSNGRTLTARHFLISTGSVVSPSPILSLNDVGYITSDDAVRLKKLPKSLIVLGGGAVAVEFAQFFARLDVKVTLIQRSPHILSHLDSDAAAVLEDVFRREGMAVYTGTQITKAARRGKLKTVSFEHEGRTRTVAAEEILFALGRQPNTAHLGLEEAGVSTTNGRIVTNEFMQTSQPHIYAAGDCTGPHEIVHIAIQQGETAAYNMTHPKTMRKIDYRLLISVVFTDPQLAQVGLNETDATTSGIPYKTASYPFNDHGKSMIMNANDGFVKLLASPTTGEILGGVVAGPMGGELIHEIAVAMAGRMTAAQLAAIPHYHPTLAEIWTYPAEDLAG